MSQNFDFTIAVSPDSIINLDKEMKYIKTALLYADSIKLISPIAQVFFELTDEKYKNNEKQTFQLIEKVIPFTKEADPKTYEEYIDILKPIQRLIYSNQYRSIPIVEKLKLRRELNKFAADINITLRSIIGNQTCEDISFLVKNNKIKLEIFRSSIDNTDGYVAEYFKKVEKSISNSYPLFDEQTNNLIGSAINEGIVNVSDIAKYKAVNAGLTDRLFVKLPSFEFAKVDEILDIRKELEKPLIRFRSKTIEYSENIQSLPWDKDFEDECSILYNKEIVPSILEIEEMINDNNIFKNLGITILTDDSMLSNAGGLVLSIAAAGVLTSFSSVISSDTAMLTTGGAWAISKIASAYDDYRLKNKEIERKDLYFYYKAGKNVVQR